MQIVRRRSCSMIQPTSSCGYGVNRTWRRDVLARASGSSRCRRSSCLTNASKAESIWRIHPGTHDRALLDDADPQRREALEHAVEDHRRQRLHRRLGDAHVVEPSGSSRRRRGSRARRAGRCGSTPGPSAGRRRRGTRSGRRPPGPSPTAGRGRRGSGSARAGTPTGPSAPRRRASSASAAIAIGASIDGERHVARRQQAGVDASRSRPCRGCGPARRRATAPAVVAGSSVVSELRNELLKISWLWKPSEVERRHAVVSVERAECVEVLVDDDVERSGGERARRCGATSRIRRISSSSTRPRDPLSSSANGRACPGRRTAGRTRRARPCARPRRGSSALRRTSRAGAGAPASAMVIENPLFSRNRTLTLVAGVPPVSRRSAAGASSDSTTS